MRVSAAEIQSGVLEPIAYYPFEGNANDASGNGNDGTVHNAVSYVQGCDGQAASFNGSSSYVELPNESRFDLSSFTIRARVKVSDYAQENVIISKGPHFGNFYLIIYGPLYPLLTGKVSYVHQTSTGNYSAPVTSYQIPTDRFLDIAVTMGSGIFTAYVDGVQQFQDNNAPPPLFNDEPVTIGAGGDIALNQFFSGVIDEVSIYNRALTASEISNLVDSELPTVFLTPGKSPTSGILPLAQMMIRMEMV